MGCMIMGRSQLPFVILLAFAFASAACGGCGDGTTGSNTPGDTDAWDASSDADAADTSADVGDSGSERDTEEDVDSGPGEPPAAPDVTVSYGVKQIRFAWEAVDTATHYRLLERADSTGTFDQLESDLDEPEVALDVSLHLRTWSDVRYIVQACNDAGCTDSTEISVEDAAVDAVGYFKAPNTEARDIFGGGVAVSDDGSTLAVSAPLEDSAATGVDADQTDNSAEDAGAVYVFRRADSGWELEAYIKASNTDPQDRFGEAIALSGDGSTLAVGAFYESGGANGVNGNGSDNSAERAGAVYVYSRRSDGLWGQDAYVKASNSDAFDLFGDDVSLSESGDTLLVGASQEQSAATGVAGDQADNSYSGAGAAYVFIRQSGNWYQVAYIKASNTDASDRFGSSVHLSAAGTYFVVGAPNEDSAATGFDGDDSNDSAPRSGAVYAFALKDGVWAQKAYLKASNTDPGDQFGNALAFSSDAQTLVVTADYEESAATGVGGDQNDNSTEGAGAAYVFARAGGSWSQEAYIKASNTAVRDYFGSDVSVSGDGTTLAVTAVFEDSEALGVGGDSSDDSAERAGSAYVYERGESGWSRISYVKASNTGSNDRFGSSVALSEDGKTLAVGARQEESAATDIGGDQSDDSAGDAGAVYLY